VELKCSGARYLATRSQGRRRDQLSQSVPDTLFALVVPHNAAPILSLPYCSLSDSCAPPFLDSVSLCFITPA